MVVNPQNSSEMEPLLKRALEKNEFVLHYQPQVDLRSGKIVSSEALLRWQSPDRGLVPPDSFIPQAEETGLIVPIGEWVLQEACRQTVLWQKQFDSPLGIAVNLSARQFQEHDLVKQIGRIIQTTGIDPRLLDLEITETYAMQNVEYTLGILHQMKDFRVKISIDDFGTGYSSLMHLKQFPIDTLKIDRSFVKDLTTDPRDAAIASAIITLAHNLHLLVVAEGVETEPQKAFLRREGCDRMQGYLFSRPLAAEAMEAFLRSRPMRRLTPIDSSVPEGK